MKKKGRQLIFWRPTNGSLVALTSIDKGYLDWKGWRKLEAANREDQVSESEDEDEDEEPEGESMVGEDVGLSHQHEKWVVKWRDD